MEGYVPLEPEMGQLAFEVQAGLAGRRRCRDGTGVLDPLWRISVSLSGRLGAGGSKAPGPLDCDPRPQLELTGWEGYWPRPRNVADEELGVWVGDGGRNRSVLLR